MGWKKPVFGLMALVLAHLGAASVSAKPQFITDKPVISVPSGKPFTFDAKTLLKAPIPAVLSWSIIPKATVPPAPTWVSVDKDTGILTINAVPNSNDSFAFILNVADVPPIDGGNTALVTLNLFSVPEWKTPIADLGTTMEGSELSFDLNSVASDPAGKPLTFALLDPSGKFPSWINVTKLAQGILSGTPARKDVTPDFSGFSFRATSVTGGVSELPGKGAVSLFFRGPKWTANPLSLPDATQGSLYTQALNAPAFLSYTEGMLAPLSCTIVAGGTNSAWITKMSADGTCTLSGTPTQANAGAATFQVTVSATYNGKVFSDTTTFTTNVKLVPPTWKANPIVLPNALAGVSYGPQDLATQINNAVGSTLQYSIVAGSGPVWASLTTAGKFGGTPAVANLGLNEWTVQVTDGQNTVTTKAQVTVQKRPPLWTANPIVLPTGLAGVIYGPQDIKNRATDPDGATLTFSLVAGSGPAWGTISSDGKFTGTPPIANIGLNEWTVAVSNGSSSAFTQLQVTIGKRPPTINNPILLPNGLAGLAYGPQDIAAQAKDPDGAGLTWSIVAGSGPAWASLSSDGKVTGTPLKANLGLNSWTVEVTNGTNKATATLQLLVVNAPPVWSANPIILPTATAGVPYGPQDISSLATSPSGAALTYSIVPGSGPSPFWGSMTSDGKFSGTAAVANVGVDTWTVSVTDGSNTVTTKMQITVVKRPPVWSANPIVLPDGTAGFPYPVSDISNKATDPDGAKLTFSIVSGSGPAWGKLSADGKFSGSPALANLGMNEWTIQVSNGSASATTKLQVNILKSAPVWSQNPIVLPNALAELAYAPQDIAKFAVDPDGAALTFSIVAASGPAWGSLTTDGKFSGTPLKANLGVNTWKLEVTNGTSKASTTLQVTVVNAPPVWSANPIILPNATAGVPYGPQDVSGFAKSPSGAALTFSLVPGTGPTPVWGAMATDGKFTGTPAVPNVGVNTWTISVTDGGNTITTKMQITVVKRAPVWAENPIVLPDGTAGFPYPVTDISSKASDPDKSPLTFSLVAGSGPAWGRISADGKFSGSPVLANLGLNEWTVQVSNGITSATTKLQVNILKSAPVWSKNPIILPNAQATLPYAVQDISKFAIDPDGAALTFTLVAGSGPAWGTLASDGKFSGTPLAANLGVNTWKVEVSNGTSKATTTLQVTVVHAPPVWSANPLILPNATAGIAYGPQDVSTLASSPSGAKLTFSIVPGTGPVPAWGTMSTDGKFTGTPAVANVGVNVWTVSVTDGDNTQSTKMQVTVVKRPPVWAVDPIVLPDGSAGVAYALTDISAKASDPDGVKLNFSIVAGTGPAWGKLSADGKFSGTPALANIGLNEWTVQVSNGFSTATAKLQVTVKLGPPAWTMNPIVLPNATAGVAYGPMDLSGFAKSPSGAPLTFSITASPSPAWGAITADGKFSGTPAVANVGLDTWTLTVNDGSNSVSTQLNITVVKRPPVWSVNPIVLPDGTATIAYPDTDISAKASDPDGSSLSFKIVAGSGPAWGALTPDGKFSGTPATANVGMNEWMVQVSNGINSADVKLRVNIKGGPPVWTANPVVLPDAPTGLLYGPQDLTKFVKAATGARLSFKVATAGGPAWAVLAADGKFTGTPSRNDVGLNKWNVEVTDGVSAPVTTEVQVMVVKRAPVWAKNPLILPAAPIGDNYDRDISTFASDPDPGETLKFMQTTASPWIFVTATGRVVGTPAVTDLGLNKITVRVTNLEGVYADVEVQIQVIQKAKPPKWNVATIDLGNATVAQRFSFDLNPYVTDPSGLPVKFRKSVAAPAWLSVSANGQVSGTPALADLGPYTTAFEASDDGLVWVPVDAFGKVIKQSNPPVLNASALFFTVRVGEDFRENLNQAKYVTSPDGLVLTFRLLNGDPWISVAADGKMQILPVLANLGDHVFELEVKDSEGTTARAPLNVKVIPAGKPPVLQDPIRYDAVVNKPFAADLVTKVTGDGPFTFKQESGKGWLTVAASGALSGTPTVLGEDFFGISVTTPSGKTAATLIVRVIPDTPDEDSVVIDAPVPGARVDNIWVVGNNPDPCSGAHCLITKLKENIDVYYDALDAADIHHYGVYLSSDACLYTTPIKDSRGKVLMAWDDTQWVKSFKNRVDRSPGRKDWSSPLVANWQFLYTAGSSIPAPFFAGRVPVETLYVSDEADNYSRAYAAWMPVKNWSPADYLDYFEGIYSKYNKSHRTSALAIASSAYKTIVSGTGGKYYTYGTVNTRDSLADYAKQVIFRAYVNAKDKVKLSKVPSDPSTIKVAIAGKPLAANQWKYDAASNSVQVYWNLIDINQYKSGDKLVITYGATSRLAAK
jgi:hypothetical protein